LSGQYIGKFQCKIGYGKATAATKIWVGGLGAWTSSIQLEGEFDRFGAIKKIEYTKGDNFAYITYESIDAATAAVKEMRGFPLGGSDKRLRIDFADNGELSAQQAPGFKKEFGSGYDYEGGSAAPYEDHHHHHAPHHHHGPPFSSGYPTRPYRGRGGFRGRGSYRGGYHAADRFPAPSHDDDWRRPPSDMEYNDPYRLRRSPRGGPGIDRSRSRSPKRHSMDSDSDGGGPGSGKRNGKEMESLRTLSEVARRSSTKWEGSLILKSSLFPAKFHLTDGVAEITESLMRDENGTNNLRITQRLRLDQPKLEDVQKRISTSTSHAIFLGLPGPSNVTIATGDEGVQTRPLRNLVSYLKQKEAAGVISLLNKETEETGEKFN
jgi:RNA-binding protein 15